MPIAFRCAALNAAKDCSSVADLVSAIAFGQERNGTIEIVYVGTHM